MKVSPKDLRTKELLQRYNRHDLVENLAEYHLLVDTLLYLHEAIVEKQVDVRYWQKDSEILFYKFTFHGLTLHQIFSGLKLSSEYYKDEANGKCIVDLSSARVIFRAQFEAFLMYHYIYINPTDDDLKELRYNAWIYSSLLQRQKFPSKTESGKQQKAKDKIELEKMKVTIRKLKSFQNLSEKRQQSLLNTGSGKLFSHWGTILKETGFSEGNAFYTIYTLLCMYAHSEGLSIIQLRRHPDLYKHVISQAHLDLHNSKLLVCLMIKSIVKIHDMVSKKFETLPDQLRFDIEIYSTMAMRDKP